jgi:hypothetical protein
MRKNIVMTYLCIKNYKQGKQGRHCTYNVTWRFRATIVAMEKQWVWHNLCVCVCVCICSLSYPACNADAPYWHLWPAPFDNILPHFLIHGTIVEKSCWTKNVFWFSLQLFFPPETLLILRRNERDIKNVLWSSCKVPFILVAYEWNLKILDGFSKSPQIWNFMKIRSVGAELFHADGQTDRVTKLIGAFCTFASTPKKRITLSWGYAPVLLLINSLHVC